MSGRHAALGFQAFDFLLVGSNRMIIGHERRGSPVDRPQRGGSAKQVERLQLFGQEIRLRLRRPGRLLVGIGVVGRGERVERGVELPIRGLYCGPHREQRGVGMDRGGHSGESERRAGGQDGERRRGSEEAEKGAAGLVAFGGHSSAVRGSGEF